MPLLWRYLIRHFFAVFALCLVSFVAILLITRSQDVAKFATLNTDLKPVLLFVVYQIPYILPFAIPISCLIATMLLFQNLSVSGELTSMRASGISLNLLMAPLFFCTGLLALLNLTLASEVTPKCRNLSKKALFQTASKNPLILLQKDQMLKIKDSYVNMEMIRSPSVAGNLVFAFRNPSTERINLLLAKQLELEAERFQGKNVSFVTTAASRDAPYDHLIIENQKETCAESTLITDLLQTTTMDLGSDLFPLKEMVIKGRLEMGKAQAAIYYEIFRRLFFLFLPLTLVYVGMVYGIQVGRTPQKQNVFYAVLLSTFVFSCYFAAKSFMGTPLIASLFFLMPHPLVMGVTRFQHHKVARGVE